VALGALNLLFGVASGAILASSLAVVTDASEVGGRGREMGRFDAVNLLGWILGFALGFGLLGTFFQGRAGNSMLWVVFAIGAVALAGGALFAQRSVRGLRERLFVDALRLERVRAAAFRRGVLLVTLPWLVIYMLLGTGFVFLGTASASSGVPVGLLAVLIGVGGLLLLLSQPAFGTLADRYGRMRLMWVGTFGFVGVLTGAALLTQYGPRPILLAFVGVSILAALAYGPAALAALGDLSNELSRATTMSLYSLVISLGMLVGLVSSTQLFSHFGNAGLDLFFGIVAGGLLLLTTLRYWDLKSGRTAVGA
jgi:MFS family permease